MKPIRLGKVSEDLLERAIKTLRGTNEEGEGAVGSSAPGGLASASDLGMLPKVGVPRVKVRRSTTYAKRDEDFKIKDSTLYMISWADTRYGEVLRGQKKLQNGVYYVTEKDPDKAKKIYQDLSDKGIDNLKLDLL